jgi:putative ABC transport system permease protein
MMGTLLQDIRYGFRMLLRNPGFTFLVVLILAVGIGASTAIFSVVNAVLLNPLPTKDSHRFVEIREVNVAKGRDVRVSPPLFLDLQQEKDVFEDMAAFSYETLLFPGQEFAETIYGYEVTPHFFTLLGVQPMAGRAFTSGEGQPGNDQVLVVSYGFWQRRFGSDPNLVGKTIILSDRPYTVIGIMPPQFQFPRRAKLGEFWQPNVLVSQDASHFMARFMRNMRNWGVVARLKPDVSRRQAQAVADILAQRLVQDHPETNTGWQIRIRPLRNMFTNEKLRQTMLGLLGAIICVLLIACANVGNLLLARSERRQKEIAIRMAVGAGRFRLVRQLLTESVLLALLAGGLGLLLTYWAMELLTALIPTNIPRMKEIAVDAGMLCLACLISVLTGVGFGLVPAWQSSRPQLDEALKEGGQSPQVGFGRKYFRNLLVVSEVALTLVLLVGAGLMIQSVARLLHVDPGFDPHNMLRIGLSLRPLPGQSGGQDMLYQQMVERLQTLPGAQSVGLCNPGNTLEYVTEGDTIPIEVRRTGCSTGSSDYFKTMNIPLLKGRYFSEEDTRPGQRTIIINEAMAQLCWPGENPLGKQVKDAGRSTWAEAYTVVGVVGNVRDVRLDYEYGSRLFEPFQRWYFSYAFLMVRIQSGLDPLTLTKGIRCEIKALAPNTSAPEIGSVEKELFDSTESYRTYLKFITFFAYVGLLLSMIGIYGVMSDSVARRTHEIGIRMALGAERSDVLKLVIKKGLLLIVVGLVIGAGGALAVTRVLRSLLFGVRPTDPMTFVAVSLLLMVVGLVACYIPARRATKIDPMVALRYE